MLDPLQERFGKFMGGILFIPALIGEVLWAATMFALLAKMFIILVGEHTQYVVILVAIVTIFNTLAGGMYSVVITDVVNLACLVIGIVRVFVPFIIFSLVFTSLTPSC